MKKGTLISLLVALAAVVALIFFISANNTLRNEKDALTKQVSDEKAAAGAAADALTKAETDAAAALEAAKAEADAAVQAVQEKLDAATEELNTTKTALEAANTALAERTAELENAKAEAAAAIEAAEASKKSTLETLKESASASLEKVQADAAEALENVKADAAEQLNAAQKLVDAAAAELEKVKADAAAELEKVKADAAAELGKAKADAAAELAALKESAAKQMAEAQATIDSLQKAKDEAESKVKELSESAEKAAETAQAATEEVKEAVTDAVETVETTVEEAVQAPAAVMDHAAYAAAALESEVSVETFVQAKQGWWDNKATIYTQSPDGAYFIYNMPISQEDYDKLVPGTKIAVKGYKAEWAGEVEITDATFEILEGDAFIAEPADVTALLGTDELIAHQNELVAFKGMTVEAYDENGAAFAYKDAVGKTDDLYFKVSKDGQTYEFCVEFYLCGKDTDVYKAVEALKVGDVVDLEGFLYWYNGANPHITAVKAAN